MLCAVRRDVFGLCGDAYARISKRKVPKSPDASMMPSGPLAAGSDTIFTCVRSSPRLASATVAPTLTFFG